MQAIWIRIDETLPWIELKGTYETRRKAKKAATICLSRTQIKIVAMPEDTRELREMATIKR